MKYYSQYFYPVQSILLLWLFTCASLQVSIRQENAREPYECIFLAFYFFFNNDMARYGHMGWMFGCDLIR